MTSKSRKLILIALFLALCVIVPIIFHSVGAGQIFLPMFLPILLAGFIIEFPLAIIVGLLGPFLSAILTGMPPLFPSALMMSIEGIAAAGLASYFYFEKKWNFWICLILSIIAERVALIAAGYILAPIFHLPAELFSFYKLIESAPGIVLQIILIPVILNLLWHKKLITRPNR